MLTIKKYIYTIPLVILLIAITRSLYIVSTSDIVFGTRQYLGITFVLLCLVFVFINKSWSIYLTGLTLILGTLNVLAFTAVITVHIFGFGINGTDFDFRVQLFSFLLLVLYLILNSRFLIDQIRERKV